MLPPIITPRALLSVSPFTPEDPASPRDIFSMLRLISPMTAVWPRLGMLGTLGWSLFLILAAMLWFL